MDRNGWAVYAARNDTMTSHNTFRIAVIAGDGIGREVIPAGMAALEAAVRGSNAAIAFTEFPWGCEHYVKHGRMLDEDGFDRLAARGGAADRRLHATRHRAHRPLRIRGGIDAPATDAGERHQVECAAAFDGDVGRGRRVAAPVLSVGRVSEVPRRRARGQND